ncbi:oligosaccharide flippase family protein [Patescibacteria group bacterium]|nr:oligosaccharide flippase family protein [Patescibacteria group bacterium]
MVYLFEGGSWMASGHIIITILSFVTVIIFANLLSPETYGSYKYILSFIGILAIPALPGMNTAIAQSIAKGNEGSFLPSIKTKIKWGFLSTLFGFVLGGYYYFNGNYTLAISFSLIGIFIPFMESFGLYTNYLHGKKLFNYMSRYDVFSSVIVSLILITTVFITNNLFILIFTFLTSWTLIRFIYLKLTLKNFKPNNQKDPNIINYSKHLSLMTLIGTISSSLDKILLWHYLGAAQVATYILALSIPTNLNGFVRILNRLAFPKLAEQNILDIKNNLLPKILKLSLLVLCIIFIYIIFAPFVFKIFFPKYLNAIIYSQILSFILLAQPIALISTAMLAQTKKRELYWLNTLSPILQIILLISLIPPFGILGAVLATLGSNTFRSILLIYLFKKRI